MARAYVVIPNWNGIDLLPECLESLRQQTLKHQVVLVDNGSVDGSVAMVRERYPEVQVIELPVNTGFTGGVNTGIEVAMDEGADYVALFNNDAVADEHWLEYLVTTAEAHPEVGAAGAKIVTQDGQRIDSTGDLYTIWGFPFPRGRDEEDQGQYDGPEQTEVFAVSGGASLYRVKMLRQIGLFDQRFFAYYEDVDVAFRGRLAGWKMRFEARAVVRHYVGGTNERMDEFERSGSTELKPKDHTVASGASTDFSRYHTAKNYVYLYTKDMPARLWWRYLPRFWLGVVMMAANSLRRGQARPWLRAMGRLVVTMPGVWLERVRVQRLRKVSAADIDRLLYKHLPPQQTSLRRALERLGLSGLAKHL